MQTRYVFWVAPHIALPMSGEEGTIYREGRKETSHACGALLALLGEIKSGKLNLALDNDDLEQTLLKQKIISQVRLKLAIAQPAARPEDRRSPM